MRSRAEDAAGISGGVADSGSDDSHGQHCIGGELDAMHELIGGYVKEGLISEEQVQDDPRVG
jgi:hypothetical protein